MDSKSGKAVVRQARNPGGTVYLSDALRHGFAPLPLVTTLPDEPVSAQMAVTNIVEPSADFTGTPGDNTYTGTSGYDTFDLSQGGNDTASGLGGNDVFTLGGALNAADRIDGGTGSDTVTLDGDYTGGNAVVMNATTMVGVETLTVAAGHSYAITTDDATVAAGQRLAVDATALGVSDTLTFNGSAETNGGFDVACTAAGSVLTGGSGNDVFTVSNTVTVHAGDGDDVIKIAPRSTPGALLDGGAGTDTLDWGTIGSPWYVTLYSQGNTANMERIHLVAGGGELVCLDSFLAAGQTLILSVNNMQASFAFYGKAETEGNFFITAPGVIETGAGNDVITGNGIVRPGFGNDTVNCHSLTYQIDWYYTRTTEGTVSFTDGRLNAGDQISATFIWLNGDYSGANAVVFNDTTVTDTQTIAMWRGYNYDLTTADATVAYGAYMFVNAENLLAANWLRFDGRAETDGRFIITGGAGNDTLYGGAGDDRFLPGGGNDAVNGGAGNDTLSYAGDTAGVSASVAAGTVTGASAGNDTLTGIENIISGAGNDVLTGDANANVLSAGRGIDRVSGAGGDDTISLDDLNAADRIDGGAGFDTVFVTGGGFTVLTVPQTITNVEKIVLKNTGASSLTLADTNVAAGQQLIVDGSYLSSGLYFEGSGETDGSFDIIGGSGQDTFLGGAGDDIVDGGAGRDAVSYAFSSSGVTVNLTLIGPQAVGGGHGADTLISIEGVIGSDYDDSITGSSGDDSLFGGEGNDALYGGAGNDTLRPGNSDDHVYGGDGNDTISFTGGRLAATDVIDGGAGWDLVWLNGDYTGANAAVFNATTITSVEVIGLAGGFNYTLTYADASVASGKTLMVDASSLGASKMLTFDGSAETNGAFLFISGSGGDVFTGGTGADTFKYDTAARSTGLHYDTINALNFANDSFDIPGAITAIDAALGTGTLSTGSFDGDLAAALSGLGAHHAMLFTPNAGTLSGQTFMVVDCNGTAGYQSGQDLVIRLNGYSGALAAGAFH